MKIELSPFNDILQVPTMYETVYGHESAIDRVAIAWPHLLTGDPRIMILCGSSGATRSVVRTYVNSFTKRISKEILVQEISGSNMDIVRIIDGYCSVNDITLLVGIGGGQVIDVAKMVAKRRSLPLLCIPTALSSDGITSPVSVLRGEDGFLQSFVSTVPTCVLVDISVTRQAPLKLTQSGVGDVLSNISALIDVEERETCGHGHVNGFAKLLSHSATQLIMPLEMGDLDTDAGHEAVASALILSGLSMAFAGNSLPCSGAEHLISHAIDHLKYGDGSHGLQVAIGSLFCLALRRELESDLEELAQRMRALGLPTHPTDININRDQFIEAVTIAPKMRPNRRTVLDRISDDVQLSAAYDRAFGDNR